MQDFGKSHFSKLDGLNILCGIKHYLLKILMAGMAEPK